MINNNTKDVWLMITGFFLFLCIASIVSIYFFGDSALFDAVAVATSRTVNRNVRGLDEEAAKAQILANDAAEEKEPGKNPPRIVVGDECPPFEPGEKTVLLTMGVDGKALGARTCLADYKKQFFSSSK